MSFDVAQSVASQSIAALPLSSDGVPDPKNGTTLSVPESTALNQLISKTSSSAPVQLTADQINTLAVLARHRDETNYRLDNDDLQKKIDDPNTSAEEKAALKQLKDDPTLCRLLDTANASGGFNPVDQIIGSDNVDALLKMVAPQMRQLNPDQMDTLSVLQRHSKQIDFHLDNDDIQKKIDDPKTPPDLQAALKKLLADPQLKTLLDAANPEGGLDGCDNYVSSTNLDALSTIPGLKELNRKKADVFLHNYTPSEGDGKATGVRDMTANDAARELYLYLDNLTENMDLKTLQDLIDDPSKADKCPPQLIAAAKFYADNPAEWSKVTAGAKPTDDGKLSRSDLLDNISKNTFLTPAENKTLETIGNNRDVFLKDGLNREKLQKIIDESSNKTDVKDAAKQLLDDPLLFGMLDNAFEGHSINSLKTVDEKNIVTDDFDGFMAHLATKGKTPPALPPVHKPDTDEAQLALAAMNAGALDDPDIKKTKCGWDKDKFLNILRKILDPILEVAGMVAHIASMALSVLSKIPILGELIAPLAIAAEAVGSGLDIADVGLNGGDVKAAAKMAALGIAGAAISAVLVPGAGAAILKGAESALVKGVDVAVVKGTEAAVVKSAGKGLAEGVESVAAKTVTAEAKLITGSAKQAAVAGEVAHEAADDVAATAVKGTAKKETTSEAGKEVGGDLKDELMDQAQDDVENQVTNSLQNAAQGNNQNNGHNNNKNTDAMSGTAGQALFALPPLSI